MQDRLEYALVVNRHMQQNPEFSNKILFIDESSFTIAGTFNGKYKHNWSRDSPHKNQPIRIQDSSLSVWCEIL